MADEVITRERELYHAYLLRLWQVESEGHMIWRASLEDPHTGQRRGFSSPAELVAFLEEITRPDPARPAASTIPTPLQSA